ncbi:MAG: ribonuclease III [Candidatus Levybacteria bacterium]|nr:ribonuclease III [Candidatus Levybacteria bacterium]
MDLPKLKSKNLFEQAFTHRSYLNETKESLSSNERLEFLGDSIISFIVSEFLYKKYPQFNEGELTNLRSLLVNTESLAEVAHGLNFGKLLRLSKGEEQLKGRENKSLLADSFEAYVGALFIDQGISSVSSFLDNVLLKKAGILAQKTLKDPKSLLQELVQAKGKSQLSYKVVNEQGPAHSKQFTVEVSMENKVLGAGKGRSKQDAEKNAAESALSRGNLASNAG